MPHCALKINLFTVGYCPQSNVFGKSQHKQQNVAITEHIVDIREADVPYYIRAAIDQGVRVGLWYDVLPVEGGMWHCLTMIP